MTERHKYWVVEVSAWAVVAAIVGLLVVALTGCGGNFEEEDDGRKTAPLPQERPR